MGCYILQQTFLEIIKEKKGEIDYEFAYQYRKKTDNRKQFIFFDLNQFQKEKNVEINGRLNNKNYFIAGIFYDCQKDVSKNAKNFLKQSIEESIYFRQGQFEYGFQNIIDGLKCFLYSCETQKKYEFENIFGLDYLNEDIITINLMMYFGGTIYLSKSVSKSKLIKNKYLVQLKNEQKLRSLNKTDISQVQNDVLLLNANISNNLQELMLTSSLCPDTFLQQKVEECYPQDLTSNSVFGDMYYLKIKKIQSLKSID
ncbi:glycosyl hydrolase family 38 protein (macronuclear) [Tetrahymena thermophila SB210]|uniref:Glycosyl hydrolase family 38 protein n=1 Tax=Tetrahymena thermophila (strain SB210) TaxID=312017 RepID=I7MIS6_TETTS|nr:glycosyl hydrolase family 38 protein [Tetrahymena thermophila SB210]EAS04706.2 glycosyl hydrolase family 38 protein [Tetrahymena thermophila SB210]|eukprot:XP_001024951.2 glycosyl hydrolase family 38 protein [Tetrahymena thermophila SB210]